MRLVRVSYRYTSTADTWLYLGYALCLNVSYAVFSFKTLKIVVYYVVAKMI